MVKVLVFLSLIAVALAYSQSYSQGLYNPYTALNGYSNYAGYGYNSVPSLYNSYIGLGYTGLTGYNAYNGYNVYPGYSSPVAFGSDYVRSLYK